MVSIYDLAYLAAVVFAVLALAELNSTGVTRLVGFEVPIELWCTTLALLAAFTPVNRPSGGGIWVTFCCTCSSPSWARVRSSRR